MLDPIHIVFAADSNYLIYAGVTVESILFQSRTPQRFFFHFLKPDDCFFNVDRQNLQTIVNRYGAKLEWVDVDLAKLGHLLILEHSHMSKMTYGRLRISELLPKLDRCLYLDCDLVVLDDLAALWGIELGNRGLAAVKDNYVIENYPHIFPEIVTYFNGGVLYLNLRRWREKNYTETCLKLAQESRYTERWADQDVLNVVLAKEVLLLDARWNITSYDWPNFWTRPVKNPGIVHYAGGRKPWNHSCAHYYDSAYWFYFARTPWAEKYREEINRALSANCFSKRFVKQLKKSVKDVLRYFFGMKFP